VIKVSWDEAGAFAEWLSRETGKRYRLPSEAEWEYAARSGGKKEKWAGTSNEGELDDFAWYSKNSKDKTHPVGEKKPNGLGLHDMSGNVYEWMQDCWHERYDNPPGDGSAWLEKDGGDCNLRVIRGGSWLNDPGSVRASFHDWGIAVNRLNDVGFRLAQDIE
jgi:sulfatase modifying factor 1